MACMQQRTSGQAGWHSQQAVIQPTPGAHQVGARVSRAEVEAGATRRAAQVAFSASLRLQFGMAF